MDYSKFYTPPEIATYLIDMLQINCPNEVIDICCGSCNLLYAAQKRWPSTRLFGIDVAHHHPQHVIFKKMDGREYASKSSKRFSLILANPPFDFLSGERNFPSLYADFFKDYKTSRLENEMFLANLILLQNQGTLLIILPNTLVDGASNKALRAIIGTNYYVKSIIRLPDDTFGTKKILSYAIILCNCPNKGKTSWWYSLERTIDNRLVCINKHNLPQKNIRCGSWNPYIHNEDSDISLDIRRGKISSNCFVEDGEEILHTAKNRPNWEPSIRYIPANITADVYAEPGDIIVSRIGKSAGQWYKYLGKRIPISDCLYCIKDPQNIISTKLEGHEFSLPLRGVATRYITMQDFNVWYHSLA